MSTKAVLEALAAGAGRQSAIGGLMFQDAQKREAQGYELALQKEKWRRSGETSALDNARKGYKSLMDNSRRDYSTYASAIVKAKAGGSDLEFPGMGTQEGIAQLESKAAELWETYQYASRKYAEYAGIDWIPTSQPTIAGGAETAGKTDQDVLVKTFLDQIGDEELDIINKRIIAGKDWGSNDAMESINAMLVEQGKAKLRDQEGVDTKDYSEEQLLEQFRLDPEEEKSVRKKLRKAIEPLSKAATSRVSLDRGGYPQAELLPPPPQTGSVDDIDAAREFQKLLSPSANVAAYGDPDYKTGGKVFGAETQDPDYIKKAEERAAQREQGKGAISKGDYGRAYKEAQMALTQLMTQTGAITKEQFMALVEQREIKGIELMAYRQAYKDLIGKKPTGLGFESGGLQERIDAGGSIPSLSNILSR